MRVEQSSLVLPKIQHAGEEGYLFLVADGMGGHAGGEEASALTLETIQQFALNTLKWFFHLQGPEADHVVADFEAALREADARVFEEASDRAELSGMGSTVTVAFLLNDSLFIVHAGDSRCYLSREGELHQLTRDHTLVQELVEFGAIAAESASRHKLRHVVTNVVGGPQPGVQVEGHKISLQAGDRILLCTDGLTEMLSDAQINAILNSETRPETICRSLITAANAAGGSDNITTILACFD
jgi:protein phosphatase